MTENFDTNNSLKKSLMPVKFGVKGIVIIGLMIALQIVFERLLTFDTPITRLSFTFIPRVICGVCLGPVYSVVVGLLADIIGAVIRGYAINPIITLAAVVRGFFYGLLLFGKQSPARIIISAALDHFFAGLVITTWGLIVYGMLPTPEIGKLSEFFTAVFWRPVVAVVLFAVEILLFVGFGNKIFPPIKKAVSGSADDRL